MLPHWCLRVAFPLFLSSFGRHARHGGFLTVVQAQDSTSKIECILDYGQLGSRVEGCKIFSRKSGEPFTTTFSYFNLRFADGLGTVTPDLDPETLARDFSFSFTVGSVSGKLMLITNVDTPPFFIYGLTNPDQSSTLECHDHIMDVDAQMDCHIVPRLLGQVVYTGASVFIPGFDPVGAAVLSMLSPNVYGNDFSFQIKSREKSLFGQLTDGFGPTWTLYVLDTPDTTSQLFCAQDMMPVGTPIDCNITARKYGSQIFSKATAFYLIVSGQFNSATPMQGSNAQFPNVSDFYTFTYLAGVQTGWFHLQFLAGAQPRTMKIWDIGDASDLLQCDDGYGQAGDLALGGLIQCFVRPRKNGVPIYSLSEKQLLGVKYFKSGQPEKSFGKLSQWDPINDVSQTFSFFYETEACDGCSVSLYAGSSARPVVISVVDVRLPTELTNFTCDSTLVDPGQRFNCTILPFGTPNTVGWVNKSAFTFTAHNQNASLPDPSGAWGPIQSHFGAEVAKLFTISYTAPTTPGTTYRLSCGYGNGFEFTTTIPPTPAPAENDDTAKLWLKFLEASVLLFSIVCCCVLIGQGCLVRRMHQQRQANDDGPVLSPWFKGEGDQDEEQGDFDDRRRSQSFLEDLLSIDTPLLTDDKIQREQSHGHGHGDRLSVHGSHGHGHGDRHGSHGHKINS